MLCWLLPLASLFVALLHRLYTRSWRSVVSTFVVVTNHKKKVSVMLHKFPSLNYYLQEMTGASYNAARKGVPLYYVYKHVLLQQ